MPINTLSHTTPVWRSTISLHINDLTSSYQGEIIPFPEKSSLLSFSTFLQQKEYINNLRGYLEIEDFLIADRFGDIDYLRPKNSEFNSDINPAQASVNNNPINDQ